MENFSNHIAIDKAKKAAAADQSSPEIEKPPPIAAAAPSDVEKLKLHFGFLNPKLIFDGAFYPKALDYLASRGLGLDFVSWLFEFCLKKSPKNLSGYLFRIFFEPRYVELFREASKPPPLPQVVLISCPVCGAEHDSLDPACPQCGFSKNDLSDQKKILFQKRLRSMEPELKNAYEEEFFLIINTGISGNFKEKNLKLKKLFLKYGLSEDYDRVP
jgi:hypothetical protein